jgi:tetratricopeptide (TPR) repeat protein
LLLEWLDARPNGVSRCTQHREDAIAKLAAVHASSVDLPQAEIQRAVLLTEIGRGPEALAVIDHLPAFSPPLRVPEWIRAHAEGRTRARFVTALNEEGRSDFEPRPGESIIDHYYRARSAFMHCMSGTPPRTEVLESLRHLQGDPIYRVPAFVMEGLAFDLVAPPDHEAALAATRAAEALSTGHLVITTNAMLQAGERMEQLRAEGATADRVASVRAQAEAWLQRAVERDPSAPRPWELWGEFLLRFTDDLDAAREVLERGLEATGRKASMLSSLAQTWFDEAQDSGISEDPDATWEFLQHARGLLEEAWESDPTHGPTAGRLALLYAATGREEEARLWAERTLALESPQSQVYAVARSILAGEDVE